MSNKIKNRLQIVKVRVQNLIVVSGLVAIMVACGGNETSLNDEIVGSVDLPIDYTLNLYCPDAGIGDEQCILDDPENPFARSIINDDTKWELETDSPSVKSSFYLWATAQAKSPRGENQYYTALALHKMYTIGGSELARTQATRGYRSLLDNYFGSVTFYNIPTPEGDMFLPQKLRELVCQHLYDPTEADLIQLFDSEDRALEALGEWGYYCNTETYSVDSNY